MSEEMTNEFDVYYGDLKTDLDLLSDLKKTVGEHNGELRSNLKHILETRGYHKKAMAIIRDIDAMSETERADVLRTLLPMMDAMNDGKWSGEGTDMLDAIDGETQSVIPEGPGLSDAPERTEEAPMEAEVTTEEGLEDFNETSGENVEQLYGDQA